MLVSGVDLQARLDAAPRGERVILEPRTYDLLAPIVITKAMTLMGTGFGSGLGTVLRPLGTFPAVTCASFADEHFLTLSDFGILPAGLGGDGIVFDASQQGACWKGVTVQRVFARCPNGRAIRVHNPARDHDAFFLASIRDCHLEGGILLDGAGDSIQILRNSLATTGGATAAGRGAGVEVNLVTGAKMLTIADNNITNLGGAVWVRRGTMVKILNNNMEMPLGPTTQIHRALVDLDGEDRLTACEVRGNYLGATSGYVSDALRIDDARNTVVGDNLIAPSGGWNWAPDWAGIHLTPRATHTQLYPNIFLQPDWASYEARQVVTR